jgi:hypothetical protein
MDSRVGVRSESGAVFPSGPDVPDGRPFDELIEAEDVVTGDAEDMADAKLMQAVDHGRADCRVLIHRDVSPFDAHADHGVLFQQTTADARRQAQREGTV